MRIQMWHVDSFRCALTEKGRSKFVEEPTNQETYVEEAIIVLTAIEKTDEQKPERIAEAAASEIAAHAENLGVKRIVVHPFAHLFADLGKPSISIKIMDETHNLLVGMGYESVRTPFGWFNRLDIRAKGHPLSRVSKIITA